MLRLVVVVVAVGLAGCTCPGPLTNTQVEPVRFSTDALRFPDTVVGAETVLQLTLTNPARVSQTVTVDVAAPFFAPASYEVPAGDTQSLSVTFRPTEAAEATAVLRLDAVDVAVSGLGLAPPMCASAPCRAARFDVVAMQCVADVLADGVSCADGCIEQGQCQSGQCVGTAAACDDADQCTVDACGGEGCVHVPRECPAASDPCQVPSCDAQTGCATRAADDGTVCGAESCITAEVNVCIGGQCVARPRPDTARCSKTWVPLVIPALWDSKLAWDAVNQSLLTLVGGQTWAWKNAKWEQQFPPASPPNEKYELAVDTWRKRVVVFMGRTTWEWDGKTWLNRGDEPESRLAPALAYDAKHRRTVRFGGSGLNGHGNDTWLWDGTRWERRTPMHAPSGRAFASMAWDPVRERVVLFGGADTSFNTLNDTWEWDGTDWRLVPISAPPSARFGASLTWDDARRSLVLIGGTFGTAVQDVWAFNGTAWVQLTVNGIAVSGHGAEWDPTRQQLIVFSLGGTWAWDGTTFTSLKAVAPNARTYAAMTYDGAREQVMLVGGTAVPLVHLTPLDELWLRDANGWSPRGVMLRPSPRHSAALAYDATSQRVLLFGGSSEFGGPMGPVGQRFDDTWAWDGAQWQQLSPTTRPAAGGVRSTTWDTAAQRVVVLTGTDGTWEFTGTDWLRRAEAMSTASFDSAIAFERTSNRLLMVTDRSTFELATDGGWSPVATASLPTNITGGKLTWDGQGNRLMLHAQNGTFAWDGATWVDLQPRARPFAEPEHLVFDEALNRVLLFTTNDEWVYLP